MIENEVNGRNLRILSDAVERWFEYYEVDSDERTSQVLCAAAVGLFRDGYRGADELATALIGTYVGLWSTRVNAPTSVSIH